MSRIMFRFNKEKALEVLLYIAKEIPDFYCSLKTLYFADIYHLEKYGRFICGDSYIAMRRGPVPSGTYDIIKDVYLNRSDEFIKDFKIINYKIIPLREVKNEKLSLSDIEALDHSIKENKTLSYIELMNKSHDASYEKSDQNDFIDIEDIVKTLPDSDSLLNHLKDLFSI